VWVGHSRPTLLPLIVAALDQKSEQLEKFVSAASAVEERRVSARQA
jgi:hypothetical protein